MLHADIEKKRWCCRGKGQQKRYIMSRKNLMSPSILSGDFWRLGEQISELEKADVEWLHIDVMDGVFVDSISYGMPVIRSLRPKTSLFFDAHLMIIEPERYIKVIADCGADSITFHYEATKDVQGCIAEIKAAGKQAGIAIKPDTPVIDIIPYLEQLDMVLVMTVNPGFGGQKLIPECFEKVREIRTIADEMGLTDLNIQVDGGINTENVTVALDSGANIIVAGSAVFRDSITDNINKFCEKL